MQKNEPGATNNNNELNILYIQNHICKRRQKKYTLHVYLNLMPQSSGSLKTNHVFVSFSFDYFYFFILSITYGLFNAFVCIKTYHDFSILNQCIKSVYTNKFTPKKKYWMYKIFHGLY